MPSVPVNKHSFNFVTKESNFQYLITQNFMKNLWKMVEFLCEINDCRSQ